MVTDIEFLKTELDITDENIITIENLFATDKGQMLQEWYIAFLIINRKLPTWQVDFTPVHKQNLFGECIAHIENIVQWTTQKAKDVKTIYTFLVLEDSTKVKNEFGADFDKILCLKKWKDKFMTNYQREPKWETDFTVQGFVDILMPDNDLRMELQMLQYSFKFRNTNLFPIYKHKKVKIFNEDKIISYAKKNFINTSYVTSDNVNGSNFREFTENYGRTIGVNANMIAPVASAEIKSAASTSYINNKSKVYSQNRLKVTRKFLRFRDAIKNETELKDYVKKEIITDMKRINDLDKASSFLSKNGQFFLCQIQIGGLRTYATNNEENILHEKSKEGNSKESNTGAVNPVELNIDHKNTKEDVLMEAKKENAFKGISLGGSHEHFFASDEKWIKSIDPSNFEICQCQFKPFYKIIPNSVLGPLREARKFLKKIYDESIKPDDEDSVKSGSKYSIQNLAYKDCYFQDEKPRCGQTDGPYFRIQENYVGDLEDENLGPSKKEISILSDEGIDEGSDPEYIGVKTWWWGFKVSKKINHDRMHVSNQWSLIHTKHGSYYLIIFDKMLGLEKVGPKMNDDDFKYVLKSYSQKNQERGINFMWNFETHPDEPSYGQPDEPSDEKHDGQTDAQQRTA